MRIPPAQATRVRAALHMLTSGLYVATTTTSTEIIASTLSWITQVSSEPKLLLLALRHGTRLALALDHHQPFVVNVLGQSQQQLARTFFKRVQATGATIGGHAFYSSPQGCPIIAGTPAWIECVVVDRYTGAGDHLLVIGQVHSAAVAENAEAPLTVRMTPWSYG